MPEGLPETSRESERAQQERCCCPTQLLDREKAMQRGRVEARPSISAYRGQFTEKTLARQEQG